jgi:hypothetical protein
MKEHDLPLPPPSQGGDAMFKLCPLIRKERISYFIKIIFFTSEKFPAVSL